jgi:hypothetical protein
MNRFAYRLLAVLTLAVTAGIAWVPTVAQAGIAALPVD